VASIWFAVSADELLLSQCCAIRLCLLDAVALAGYVLPSSKGGNATQCAGDTYAPAPEQAEMPA